MPETIEEQTKQVMENLKAVLAKEGKELQDIAKTTIMLTDMADFDAMNKVYGSYFTEVYPARVCFGVKELPKRAKIEIDATLYTFLY